MKNEADYSQYTCPFSHIEKDCGHKLQGPEGFENTYGVWCACGFRGPVFILDPKELKLEPLKKIEDSTLYRCTVCGRVGSVGRCCGDETREPIIAGGK